MVWSNPAMGRVSSPYGARKALATTGGKTGTFHAGVDIANETGTPVHAASTGRVVFAGLAGTGLAAGRSGLAVVIRHPGGQDSYYGHLHTVRVRVGEDVVTGQRIGDMGATGNVTGPHLHFEIRPRWRLTGTTDPATFLAQRGVRVGVDRITVALQPASRDTDRTAAQLRVDGDFGAATVAALQRALSGVGEDVGPADGDFGERTVKAYQRWLARCGFYGGRRDGRMGRLTVMGEQRWLRSHGLYPYGVDGSRGPRTVAALQAALNRGAIS